MKRRRKLRNCLCSVAFVAVTSGAHATVVEFFDDDRDDWFASVLAVTTIGFTEVPHGTFLADQYEYLGVLFLDGDDEVLCCDWATFPQDGAGLDGNAAIHLLLDSPQRWIAADFPGALEIDLYFKGEQVHQSSGFGYSGINRFGGLIATSPFDEVIMFDWDDLIQVNLDDLHFGYLPLGDIDGDGQVGVQDVLALVGAWGSCPEPCPPTCVGDIDADCSIGVSDLLVLLGAWGPNPGHPADLDGDDVVGVLDLLSLLSVWGGSCPPVPCPADTDLDGTVSVSDLLNVLGNWGEGL